MPLKTFFLFFCKANPYDVYGNFLHLINVDGDLLGMK